MNSTLYDLGEVWAESLRSPLLDPATRAALRILCGLGGVHTMPEVIACYDSTYGEDMVPWTAEVRWADLADAVTTGEVPLSPIEGAALSIACSLAATAVPVRLGDALAQLAGDRPTLDLVLNAIREATR